MNNDQDIDVIESTAEEAVDNELENLEEIVEEPIASKAKGGFFGFLTFLIAAGALGLSGYQYYMSLKQPQVSSGQWQQPLEQVKAELQQFNSSTNNKLQNFTKSQNKLSQELKSLNSTVQNVQSNPRPSSDNQTNAGTSISESRLSEFDTKFTELNQTIKAQNQQIKSLNTELKKSQQRTAKSLESLKGNISAQPLALTQELPEPKINFELIRAETHLKMAAMYLDIHSNKGLAIGELKKAEAELKSLNCLLYTSPSPRD